MNATNPVLQLLAALQAQPAGKTAPDTNASGLVGLFAQILANAQGGEPAESALQQQPVQESSDPAMALLQLMENSTEAADSQQALASLLEEAMGDEADEGAKASLMALMPNVLQKASETAFKVAQEGAKQETLPSNAATEVAMPQTGKESSPASQAEAQKSAVAVLPASAAMADAAEGEGIPPMPPATVGRKSGNGILTKPLPQSEAGAEVVMAVREARVQAQTTSQPPGLTIRQLLSEVHGLENRLSVTPGNTAANPAASLDDGRLLNAMLIGPEQQGAEQPQETLIRLPSGAESRPLVGETVRADTVQALRPPPVAQRPVETVVVHEVGDFTLRSVRYLSGRGEEVLTVRLVPQSLGEMQIAVRSGSDGMEVVLTTATAAARDAVEMQLHGLRDALARDGLDVSRVSVQTSTANAGHSGSPGQPQGSPQQPHGNAVQAHRLQVEPEHQPVSEIRLPRARDGGKLNLLA